MKVLSESEREKRERREGWAFLSCLYLDFINTNLVEGFRLSAKIPTNLTFSYHSK